MKNLTHPQVQLTGTQYDRAHRRITNALIDAGYPYLEDITDAVAELILTSILAEPAKGPNEDFIPTLRSWGIRHQLRKPAENIYHLLALGGAIQEMS